MALLYVLALVAQVAVLLEALHLGEGQLRVMFHGYAAQ
jgi:hypothetical protein